MKDLFAPEDLNQISPESLEKMPTREVIQLALRLRNFRALDPTKISD